MRSRSATSSWSAAARSSRSTARSPRDEALIDESTLTGEPLPATHRRGDAGAQRRRQRRVGVRAGARPGRPPRARTRRSCGWSRRREQQSAPFVRVADRYAAFFLPFALGVAGIAWAVTGDPLRALAVLVVATPCPLILAAPIALVAGVSRAASIGVVVKGAAVIERLGGARSVLLDKTGTVTVGAPTVERVDARGPVAGRRAAAPRCLARSALGAHRRTRTRARGAGAESRAACARAGGRGAGERYRGAGGRAPGRGRKRHVAAGPGLPSATPPRCRHPTPSPLRSMARSPA